MNNILKLICMSIAVLCFDGCNQSMKSTKIVFCSWGGTYQDAQREAYLSPFQKENKVTIQEATYSGELAKVKAMVENKNVTWDVISVTQEMFSKGAKSGLFQNLDYSNFDTSNFINGSIHKEGVAHLVFTTALAYNSNFYRNKPRPNGWKDFWNVKEYPGKRALHDSPVGNLEFALLADGVKAENLYPLDVERAFKKLDEIKPFIQVWWQQGQQPIQLITSGEVQLATAYNGRILKAKSDGQPIDIDWNGGMLEPEYFVIPKGSPDSINAMKLITFALKAEQQKKFVELIPYGPTNLNALKLLPDSVKVNLPDSEQNIRGQFFINGEWWADNYDSVLDRWNTWKLKK